ncbi:hypothetical protein [Ligilactobacillus apodemi]|nr:hypothetical protein [Ligilactobacillus apodemi]MCR1902088.1 hypothetical protein [Ligilactobacillus apodemi]
MPLSTTLVILLICLFGLLMILSAVNMHEKSSLIMRGILFMVGLLCVLVGIYLVVQFLILN